ncbi:MAG: TIGR03619 family F420-dependent LLM class oxidoreductase [Actinobacteria bacterium]|nr:TIGR03619 family F420-dependent LLM class oxidoreductase [Actinomycetota bacterium]
MRFSLWIWPYARWGGLEEIGRVCERAEELGFAGVSVSDHTICTVSPESAGAGPDWPDWSVLSTYIAMRTSRIRILSCVVIPYRPLLPQAKQIATVDQVSGGRFILAPAVGWLKPEFEMLGVDYSKRGAITDEYLRAMRELWTAAEPEFHGEHAQIEDVIFEPKCAQRPHVPIWVAGGNGEAVIRRVLELGDGWMPMGGDLDTELRGDIVRIRERAAAMGRDPDSLTFRYTIGIGTAEAGLDAISKSIEVEDPTTLSVEKGAESVVEAIAQFEGAGFDELAINFAGTTAAEVEEKLEWFAAEVMPLLPSSSSERQPA